LWWRSTGKELSSLVACNVHELQCIKDGKREFLSTFKPSPWLRWENNMLTLPEGERA
jgi:hypothetical protein